jgi:hypothetical protein
MLSCQAPPSGGARSQGAIPDLANEMHLPMNEARDLVQAIELAGLGITELGSDYGAAVTTLARAAAERLTTFDDLVMDLIQLAYHFEEAAGIER